MRHCFAIGMAWCDIDHKPPNCIVVHDYIDERLCSVQHRALGCTRCIWRCVLEVVGCLNALVHLPGASVSDLHLRCVPLDLDHMVISV